MQDFIQVFGAKIHNLRNINVSIPKNKLTVICGISGSGKSSLAFDTIYQEGQRRYLESLSSYARQFLGGLKKPPVDKIVNLSPTIAINQKTVSSNPRSTVGTITEIYDYLRLLFARIGKPYCPRCKIPISAKTAEEIAEDILKLEREKEIFIFGPAVSESKGTYKGAIEQIYKSGFSQIRIDSIIYPISEALNLDLDKNKKHNIDVLVAKIKIPKEVDIKANSKKEKEALKKRKKNQQKILKELKIEVVDYVKTALKMGNGLLKINFKNKDKIFSSLFSCPKCGFSVGKIEPKLFSFNSPLGACPKCQGLGKRMEIEPSLIINPNLSINQGGVLAWERFSRYSRRATGAGWQKRKAFEAGIDLDIEIKNLCQEKYDALLYGNDDFEGVIPRLERLYLKTESDFVRKQIAKYMVEKPCLACSGSRLKEEALSVIIGGKNIFQLSSLSASDLKDFFLSLKLAGADKEISDPIFKETVKRLEFLEDVGLEYISLQRDATTLSVGENQRIRLACQLGSGLSHVIYVLDEPTVGLAHKDVERLVKSLQKLRDLKNTVIVVEHDLSVLKSAEWIVEIGPRAGKNGGKTVFEGTFSQFKKSNTLTAKYVFSKLKVQSGFKKIEVSDKDKYLKILKADKFNLKNVNLKIPLSRLVGITGVSGSGKSTLAIETLTPALKSKISRERIFADGYERLEGFEDIDRLVLADQSPIGRTPRSNPATYVGFFSEIRSLFASTQEAKMRGYTPSHFSFNTKAGRCAKCAGEGFLKIEMYFLPDVYVECEQCGGKRYSPQILDVKWHGKNIAEVLEMSVSEAQSFFYEIDVIEKKLKALKDIGLGYMKIGQPAPTLSGGEAQRIRLAKELFSRTREKTLYILDEPTIGLHFDDTKKLLSILRKLVAQKNSVLVIEHNEDVLKECDWMVELGPGGGEKGGEIIFEGDLKSFKKAKTSTSKFL